MKKYYNTKGFIFIIIAIFLSLVFPGFAYISYSENDMSSVYAFLFGAILVIGIFLILVPKYFKSWQRIVDAKNAYNELPDKTESVTIINKNKKNVGDRFSSGSVFYITFEMPDGERKNFRVTHNDYAVTEKGDTGILTYKEGGNHLFFVSFKRTTNTQK